MIAAPLISIFMHKISLNHIYGKMVDRMGTVRFLTWLTVRRTRRAWGLVLASTTGVLLAVTLMAVAVIHSNTLASAGLTYAVKEPAEKGALNLIVAIGNRPSGLQDYQRVQSLVEERINANLGWLSRDLHRSGLTQELPLAAREDHLTGVPLGAAQLYFQGNFEQHMNVISGRWPQEAQSHDDGPLEVVMSAYGAGLLGWEVGKHMSIVPFDTSPTERVTIKLVGLIETIDSRDPYWFGGDPRLELEDRETRTLISFYTLESAFFAKMGDRYPMLLGDYWWFVSLDAGSLDPETAVNAAQSIERLESELEQTFPRSSTLSALGDAVDTYHRALIVARVPLFLFISLVVCVILYYLALLSWLLARSRGPEAAMLRSRGASRFQVSALIGLGEGLVVVIPSVIIGPFLGLAVATILPIGIGKEYDFHGAHLSLSVFLISILAGLACIAVFVASGLNIAAQSIVDFLRERTRPAGRAVLYRRAIDILVLAIVALLWWQIQGQGGFLTRGLVGDTGLELDLTLLLGPALGFVAIGLILLRVLPYALRTLARTSRATRSAWLLHSLNRMARDPLPYGALAVLLMLAAALGVFGSTFGPTLTTGLSDRVRYDIGGEVVIGPTGNPTAQGMQQGRKLLGEISGIQTIADINRGDLHAIGTRAGGINANLLAVNPSDLVNTAWFRKDFSQKSLADLLIPIQSLDDELPGIELPSNAESIGVWARPELPSPGFTLWVRYRDSKGLYEHIPLGEIASDQWQYFEADFPERLHLTPPFTPMAFYVSGGLRSLVGKGSLAIDDVTVVVGGKRFVVEDFETPQNWYVLPNLDAAQDRMVIAQEAAKSGSAGALFSWAYPLGGPPRGFFLSPVPFPVPAIGGPTFAKGQIVLGRIGVQAVAIQVSEIAELFPTLDPVKGPFLVMNIETLNSLQNSLPLPRRLVPSAHWLEIKDGTDYSLVESAIREVVPMGNMILKFREPSAQRVTEDPLTGGAWTGLAWLAIGTLLGVAMLGYVLYAALSFRHNRLELGLLRALGFSKRQIGMLLGLGGIVVAVVGVGAGFGTGAWIGQWVMGYLDITVGGRTVAPPMILTQDTISLASAYVGVTLAAVLGTLLTLYLASQLRLATVLRVDE